MNNNNGNKNNQQNTNESPFNYVTNAPQFISAPEWNTLIRSRAFGLTFNPDGSLVIANRWLYKYNEVIEEYQFIRKIGN